MNFLEVSPARLRQDLPNLFSLLIFFGVVALFFRSWEFAMVVTASLGFHEVGHAVALMRYRLDWYIHFGVVGAWTWSSAEQRAGLSQLSNAFIHLAGPFFSLVLALVALVLHALWQPQEQARHLMVLANFSAQVGFLNLLPFGPMTDGGKIMRRMIALVEPKQRARVIWLPTGISLLMLALYGLVQFPRQSEPDALPLLGGLLLVGLWLTGSLWLEARSSDRRIIQSGPALVPVTGHPIQVRQVVFLLLVVWDLLTMYLLIISVTPFWLEPQYVRGSLINIMTLLRWLFPTI